MTCRPAGCTQLHPICTQCTHALQSFRGLRGVIQSNADVLSRPVGPPSSAAPAGALLGLSKPQRQRGGLAWLIGGVDEHSKPSHI
jgi:hypothetical protein